MIAPAAESRRIAANDRGAAPVYIDMRGAMVDQDLWGRVTSIARFEADGAAMRGAAGGAAIGQAEALAAGARRLGRYR
jgi:hypothetical protein